MSRISTATSTSLNPLVDEVRERTPQCRTLEEAAQVVADVVYQEFSDSVVLTRVYATVPFGELREPTRTFVTELATDKDIMPLIRDDTLILSLLGTRGQKDDWNDRRKSQGHMGIPLASAAFVDKIPMIARLLGEVGLSLEWIDSRDTDIVAKAIGGTSGIFYVDDAKQAIDHRGRKIIAAQDFVEANDVRTVFGLADNYPDSKTFVTLIVFCNETLSKSQAELFSQLVRALRDSTIPLVSREAVFT